MSQAQSSPKWGLTHLRLVEKGDPRLLRKYPAFMPQEKSPCGDHVPNDDRGPSRSRWHWHLPKNLSNWLLQERDKLLRYRKQRKKMAKLPKVKKAA